MKVGVIQPWMRDIGGAERLACFLATEFDASIYTIDFRPDIEMFFPGVSSHVVPIGGGMLRSRNPLAIARAYSRLPIDADVLVYITPRTILLKGVMHHTPYLYYVTTPKREIYVAFHDSWSRRNFWGRMQLAGEKVMLELTWKQYLKHFVDPLATVTISRTAYERYRRVVSRTPLGFVYPPVQVSKYRNKHSEDFFLSVNRLAPLKGVEMQIEAFRKSDSRLLIAGDGPYKPAFEREVRRLGLKNIELIGNISDEALLDLYSRCRAIVYTTFECEFGLVCVEAMSSGKPVLSINRGAPTEYVVHGRNGFLFEGSVGLRQIVNETPAEEYDLMRDECYRTACRFDVSRWRSEMETILRTRMNEGGGQTRNPQFL